MTFLIRASLPPRRRVRLSLAPVIAEDKREGKVLQLQATTVQSLNQQKRRLRRVLEPQLPHTLQRAPRFRDGQCRLHFVRGMVKKGRRPRGQRGRKVRFSIEAARAELGDEQRDAADARLATLREVLSGVAAEYVVRDDSRLAWAHAVGEGDATSMTLPQVATELCAIQHLYNDTDYGAMCQSELPLLAQHYKARFPHVPWARLWKIVREHAIPVIKLQAASQAAGSSPFEP